MQKVSVSINDAAGQLAIYGAGALARLERATAEAGVYTEIATNALVAGTDFWIYGDATGTSAHWYRARFTKADATSPSDYSDPFQAGALSAYASIEDLVEGLQGLPDFGKRNLNMLSDILVDASALITARCGRDFYRHPQVSGSESRLFDVSAPSGRLVVLEGIVSLDLVEYTSNTGGTYASLLATDWFLRPTNPEPEDSRYELLLNDQGSIGRWYRGTAVVRLTGVFGYAAVPSIIRRGTLALAREMYALSPTGRGGASIGMADTGSSQIPEFLPRATYEAINWGARRTRAWV